MEKHLPSYAYSPWKAGRGQTEREELLRIEEIRIPDGIEELGNYTFYGCRNLRSLFITDSLKTIGGGSFTGCGALRELHVLAEEGNSTCIRDVVSETFHEVYVYLTFRVTGRKARLIFPEYYEEGVENTPARILETHFHGCGYKYRQCFTDKKVDFQRYDKLFPTALVYEKPEILLPMAMGRLLWPYQLTEEGAAAYKAYIKDKLQLCGNYYLGKEEQNQVLTYLGEAGLWTREDLEEVLAQASKRGQIEAVSLLMEEKRKYFPQRAVKDFQL